MNSQSNLSTYKTQVAIRVIAKGGKYLGDDINGAIVTVRHAITNALLDAGKIQGGSGNIYELMVQPRNRQQALPVDGASVFTATINSNDTSPIPLLITAMGPGAGLQSAATTSVTQWIVPGINNSTGNVPITYSCTLELPGLIVQAMQPPTHFNVATLPQLINFEVNVAMMCGCPIDDKTVPAQGSYPSFPNPWPVNDFYVGCDVVLENKVVGHIALKFDAPSKQPGRYTGSWTMKNAGFYTGNIVAYQFSTGNTGCATVSFFNI